MKTRWAIVAVLALGAGCAHNMNNHDEEGEEGNEVEMTLDQVPAPVRATLNREADGATIKTVDKEQSHGKTVYETDVMSGGKNWEIRVDENGRLLSKKVDNEEDEKSSKKEDDEKEERGQH
jgi:uncharacterized membrane protein YkoI